jgi:hypothetical protein
VAAYRACFHTSSLLRIFCQTRLVPLDNRALVTGLAVEAGAARTGPGQAEEANQMAQGPWAEPITTVSHPAAAGMAIRKVQATVRLGVSESTRISG